MLGARGPITICADLLSQHTIEYYYGPTADYPGQVGAEVRYRGHRDDLVAAGCISREVFARTRYGHFDHEGERSALLVIFSKAAKGKRGWVQVSYYVHRRAVAAALPGFLDLFPEGLPRCAPRDRDGLNAWLSQRPRLRLVVDNTRVQP
jgi:hypothetical protein